MHPTGMLFLLQFVSENPVQICPVDVSSFDMKVVIKKLSFTNTKYLNPLLNM